MTREEFDALVARVGLTVTPFHQTPHTGGTLYNPEGSAVATYWYELGNQYSLHWLVKELKNVYR